MSRILFVLFSILLGVVSNAQSIDNDLDKVSELRKQYRFEEAVALLEELRSDGLDSLTVSRVDSLLVLCENGRAMLGFGDRPVVLSSFRTTKEEMLQFIPSLEDGDWSRLPDSLSGSDVGTVYDYIFSPEGATVLYYSAVAESGTRDIFVLEQAEDGTWLAPRKLNSDICSPGNEIFPVLSKDGRRLFFASDGISGYGGYDVYFCEWDEEKKDWGIPQNFGFPYNSPENDYYFLDGYDGIYSILASDRGMEGRDVTVYAMVYNSTPVKYEIGEEDAREVAKLKVYTEKKKESEPRHTEIPDEFKEYYTVSELVAQLEEQIDRLISDNEDGRGRYSGATGDERKIIKERLVENEMEISRLRKELKGYAARQRHCEMELVSKGLSLPEKVREQSVPEEAGALPPVPEFSRNRFGTLPEMQIKPAEPEVDLDLKILDEAQVMDGKYLPETGLYYQVQLFTVAGKVRMSQLHGLSPVFAERTNTGKYIYRAGIFYSYSSAAEGMKIVKRAGIRNVFLSAVKDGKSISVNKARQLEKSGEASAYQIAISGYDSMPAEVIAFLRNICDKDIAKVVEDGESVYIIGPFGNKADVDRIVSSLEDVEVSGIEIREL